MSVLRPGFQTLCTLPEGYDKRTQLAVSEGGTLIIAHPERPAMYFDDGEWHELRPIPQFAGSE